MPDHKEFKSILSENMTHAFSRATALVCMVAIAIAVIGGPFGTFETMTTPLRTLFWIVIISVSVLIGYSVRALTMVLVGQDKPLAFDVTAILLMTLIFAPTVWLIGQVFDRAAGATVPPLNSIYLYVFVVSLGVFVVRRLTPGIEPYNYAFLSDEAGSLPAEAEQIEPRLMRRLSTETQGTVLRLSGRDHHVEIATDKGIQTLRLRLADAIHEMEPIEGYCAHRSHWVARTAVVDIERDGSHKIWLILKNGDRVPVSRKYRAGLEHAGIL
ncbi:MAG: LytTR family DNA-binding domain-containing protein [Pseudomonadota bacterium]